jgi:hypothetical protein
MGLIIAGPSHPRTPPPPGPHFGAGADVDEEVKHKDGMKTPPRVSLFDLEVESDLEIAMQAHQRHPGATAAPPVHVGGTSGTGKSSFALYLLHTLLHKYPKNAFVYRHGFVNPGCFVYYQGKSYFHVSVVQVFSDSLLLKFLTCNFTRQIWTILDGEAALPTRTPEANMIVLSTPGQIQESTPLKILLKYATTIVNPPWTLKDIEVVRHHSFPNLDKAVVRDAFMKWGGIPRTLLDDAAYPLPLKNLEDSIYTADPEILFRQAGLPRIDHANVSGMHFHLVPGEIVPDDLPDADDHTTTFMYASYCWASTWLENRFWEELKNRDGELNVMTFLMNRNNISAARAYAFEPHVFRTIENTGLSGRFKELSETADTENDYDHKLPPLSRATFSNFSEIPQLPQDQVDRFFVPWATNHTSIDFYVPSLGLLVQITIGQKHGVKRSGLDAALNSGVFDAFKADNPGQKLFLVFLCDKYNYDAFTRQNYIGSDGRVIKRQSVIDRLDNQVAQYAWELDVGKQKAEYLEITKRISPEPVDRHSTTWRENPHDDQQRRSNKAKPKPKPKAKTVPKSKRKSESSDDGEKSKKRDVKGKGVDPPVETTRATRSSKRMSIAAPGAAFYPDSDPSVVGE